MEIMDWVFYKDEKEEEKIFSDDETFKIHKYFIDKFKLELNSKDFFTILPDNELWKLLLWWKKLNDITIDQFLKKEFKKGVSSAISFIKVFTPTIISYGDKGPQNFKSGFDETSYNSMGQALDLNTIYALLIKADFKILVKEKIKKSDREPLTDAELASIFMEIHERKQTS